MKKAVLIIIGFTLLMQLSAQQSTTGKYRPENVSKGISGKITKDQVIISNIPSYLWQHGCGPTALGMVIGYYDLIGFSDLIIGDASAQNVNVNNAVANTEHYDDYSVPKDYYPDLFQDKSELGGAHTSDCIADFMQTSWSSENNRYGWSWSSLIDNAFEDFIQMQNSNYFLNTTYDWFSGSSWDAYKIEINNNRPVVLLVDSNGDGNTDHFVTGIGYDDANQMYAIYDTWDNNIHWYLWREMSSDYSWGIYGFNILDISFSSSGYDILACANPSNGGTVSGVGSYNHGETANLSATPETGYDFVNWTENEIQVSTNTNYSFTVTGSRTLAANFNLSTLIVEKEKGIVFKIYPIPTNKFINIEINKLNKNYDEIDIVLYDYLGKANKIENYSLHQNTITLNLSDKKSGIYYLVISIERKEYELGKIVIIR